jgi:4-amino-4-deoxy-L-arabinose transferase-like glycosyltransferase
VSKPRPSINSITRLIFLVLVGLIALSEPILILAVLVPVVGWVLWRNQDRIGELERRLAALERPPNKPAEV